MEYATSLAVDLFLDGRKHAMRRWLSCPRVGDTVFVEDAGKPVECIVKRVVYLIQRELRDPQEIDIYLERAQAMTDTGLPGPLDEGELKTLAACDLGKLISILGQGSFARMLDSGAMVATVDPYIASLFLRHLNAAPAREAQARAEAYATGHAAGQAEMRERAAVEAETQGKTPESFGCFIAARRIRALTPEEPDTERKG